MDHIANEAGRRYRSDLRARQAASTRDRILDATVRVMAEGLAELTVPAVARAAGVSVPTVYRNFRTKRELLAGLQPYLQQRARIDPGTLPTSIDGLRDTLVSLIGGMEGLDEVLRAALASPAGEAARRVHAPRRFALARAVADAVAPDLSGADRDRVARLLVVLTSSSALRMWRDHLGLSVDETADEIDRALRALIADLGAEASR